VILISPKMGRILEVIILPLQQGHSSQRIHPFVSRKGEVKR